MQRPPGIQPRTDSCHTAGGLDTQLLRRCGAHRVCGTGIKLNAVASASGPDSSTGLVPAESDPGRGLPLQHPCWDTGQRRHVCTGTGPATATSPPRLGSPRPHLPGTGLTPQSAPLRAVSAEHVWCVCGAALALSVSCCLVQRTARRSTDSETRFRPSQVMRSTAGPRCRRRTLLSHVASHLGHSRALLLVASCILHIAS